MLTWAKLIQSLAQLWSNIVGYFRDKRLLDAGRYEAELDAKIESENISDAIDDARSNDELRDATREKYLRD